MTYPQSSYIDCPPYSLCTEPSMDPEVKRSVSPTSTAASWQVNRFLTDKKSPYLRHPAMDSVPLPQAIFQRPGSPSCTNSSSTCSSGLSPPGDTEYYQVGSPPTPSDVPLFSPYESWHSHPQVYQFTGLAEGCVSLGDVNLVPDLQMNYYDDNSQRFGYPIRSCSMSSDGSQFTHAAWNGEEVPRPSEFTDSPTPDIKEEICIPDRTEDTKPPDSDTIGTTNEPESPYLKTEPMDADEDNSRGKDVYSPYDESKTPPVKPIHTGKNYKRRGAAQLPQDAKRTKTTMQESLVVRSSTKSSIQGGKGQYACPTCLKVTFKDRNGLDNHIKKQHTRPFTCIFEFADCHSTFASKNEWKRHCASQHIVLQYWVCQQDACAQVSNKPTTSKRSSGASRRRADCPRYPAASASALPNGTIFNRKDLYTQHLRRMHVPMHLKNKVKSKTHVPEWEERQRVHQDEAIRTRCKLPTHMLCPAPNCNVRFDGASAWDDRMEHVAKHLEKVAIGAEPPMRFGGDDDNTLIDWATSPAIGILRRGDKGKWTLQNPLKATGYSLPPMTVVNGDDEDVDAEGEEVDE
ncbi:hypothetical protein F4777DRAFT_503603 [Nemania sp. FL0916]|nr:hypothetical protein F4777DRAFT_503603 [Nemania sp. FL0916]